MLKTNENKSGGNQMSNKKTIYFLCTGNSCRSQMAEGWAKKYLSE